MIIHGDCIEVMTGMDPESVDAVVTDPPYGLGFMGKAWDDPKRVSERKAANEYHAPGSPYSRMTVGSAVPAAAFDGRAFQEFSGAWAEAAYRVAKPSAYLLAFGGTRTVHRMTVALEDAGWIIRDMLVWGYASGFPKSKASLKPAWEPIVMARKPGPLRDLAIDACRIPMSEQDAEKFARGSEAWVEMSKRRGTGKKAADIYGEYNINDPSEAHPAGRWPANIVLTDPIFDGGIEGVVGGGEASPGTAAGVRGSSGFASGYDGEYTVPYGDAGTYSRFFLIPKADRADREPVLGGLSGIESRQQQASIHADPDAAWAHKNPNHPRRNGHPTVKPTDLMRHLVRLVTPTGGTVLDPFLGSGTTGLAAEMEGFPWIGIEREAEYVAIAEARLNGTQRGLGLEAI